MYDVLPSTEGIDTGVGDALRVRQNKSFFLHFFGKFSVHAPKRVTASTAILYRCPATMPHSVQGELDFRIN